MGLRYGTSTVVGFKALGPAVLSAKIPPQPLKEVWDGIEVIKGKSKGGRCVAQVDFLSSRCKQILIY